ncbi:hypothetical protein JAAARDRAFT_142761 [Jaapia argillacea MUCL 33604]|uniref:F-box domain-containing protein n=1 Tax=Jaapia argillacea MUCL 33604 TaxID=933084 RepID=A0A067P4R2_9AGAM|nr:hypothetical protein JAAARDRAFT_142761 [Jaapia argillacea MUCL 33604]
MLQFRPVKTNHIKQPDTPISQSVLDRCPLEICEHIFSFACTDDGTTAISLSLVSRYIYQTSKLHRHQSIAVESVDKMLALCNVLETIPVDRRRVNHLFVVHHKPSTPSGGFMDGLTRSKSFALTRRFVSGRGTRTHFRHFLR